MAKFQVTCEFKSFGAWCLRSSGRRGSWRHAVKFSEVAFAFGHSRTDAIDSPAKEGDRDYGYQTVKVPGDLIIRR